MSSNRKISNLPSVVAASIIDSDILPIVVAGVTSKVAISELRVKLGTNPPAGGRTVTDTATYLLNNAVFNVKDFGAFGDGSHNDTTAVQAAIDAAAAVGGGQVLAPPGNYICNVVLKQGVTVIGHPVKGYLPGAVNLTRFTAAATGAVIDTPVGAIGQCGVIGVNVQGLGAGTAGKGIRFRNVAAGVIRACSSNNFADEGFLVESPSIACSFSDLQAVNCVLNRTRAGVTGAVDINGTDHYLSEVESTTSSSLEGVVSSANLYCVALAIRMSTGTIDNCIGEISDVGVYVSGSLNKFSNTRGDLNYGHGWLIVGGGNQFSDPQALNNSQDTTNLYDGFNVSGVNNQFTIPQATSTTPKVHRYGINDTAPAGDSNKNRYVAPYSGNHGTLAFKDAAGGSSTTWTFPRGSRRTLAANATAPNVEGYENFVQTNTNPTTITDFPGGVNGQVLSYLCNDSNTTIQHNGATIITWNAGNVKLRLGNTYLFLKNGSAWNLIGEDSTQTPQVSADNGDAAKNVLFRVSEPTQMWKTPLTANRKATHSNSGAKSGAKIRHVRTAAATGASTLDLAKNDGTVLKSLAVSQWADMEHDGVDWFVAAFGSL